jgi:hypothetical protein
MLFAKSGFRRASHRKQRESALLVMRCLERVAEEPRFSQMCERSVCSARSPWTSLPTFPQCMHEERGDCMSDVRPLWACGRRLRSREGVVSSLSVIHGARVPRHTGAEDHGGKAMILVRVGEGSVGASRWRHPRQTLDPPQHVDNTRAAAPSVWSSPPSAWQSCTVGGGSRATG